MNPKYLIALASTQGHKATVRPGCAAEWLYGASPFLLWGLICKQIMMT
jgi:hypothetical protein